MSIFDKDEVAKPKVEGPVMVNYIHVKTKQKEPVVKGSKAEKLLIKSRSWKLIVAPIKK